MLGNLGEMAKMLSRFKDIQKGMKEFREELPRLEFTASSANGEVTAVLTGEMLVKRLEFAPGTDPQSAKTAIIEAVNAAGMLVKVAVRDKMKELSGGIDLDLPGLM